MAIVPKVAVIVLNWNGRADTVDCIISLSKVSYPNLEIIAVDNGSIDDSVAAIRKSFPAITLLETGRNLGYAGGNNVGLRHALSNGADFVMLLNNDTTVSPDVVHAFLGEARKYPHGALFSAKIYNYYKPNVIWYAGAIWRPELPGFSHIGEDQIDSEVENETSRETAYACGCALFSSTNVVRMIGYLDETYFLYWEDVDWSYRARSMRLKCVFVPQAKVWHKISQSSDDKNTPVACYYNVRNGLMWAAKHLSRSESWRFKIRLFRACLPNVNACTSSDSWTLQHLYWTNREYLRDYRKQWGDGQMKAKLLGIRDYLLGRYGHQEKTTSRLRKAGSVQVPILQA